MRDDRPLHVMMSRLAVILGIPVRTLHPDFPADPNLRIVWDRQTNAYRHAVSGEAVATYLDVDKWHNHLSVTIRTPSREFRLFTCDGLAGFRRAFDAWEAAQRGVDAYREVSS